MGTNPPITSFALLIMTDGRDELVERAERSAAEQPPVVDRAPTVNIHDDTGERRARLAVPWDPPAATAGGGF